MTIQIWPCEEANVHRAAQFSAVGILVTRVTSPAPPNGGTFYTACPSEKLDSVRFTLAGETTFDASFNRHVFNVEMTNLPGILLSPNAFVDLYRNRDSSSGATNFTVRARAEVGQGFDHKLQVLDSTGAVIYEKDNPFVDNTPAKIDVVYRIHASIGGVLIYIDGVLVQALTAMNTKAASSAQCIHTHSGHDNLGGGSPTTTAYYSGFRSDTATAGSVPPFAFVRFRPNYNGIKTPARCNDVGTVITPGDDLTTSISEKISDDLGGNVNRCGYTPSVQSIPLGGAWPCDRIDNKGPVPFFGDQTIVHACQFLWWYDAHGSSHADDPWLTYGHLDQSGAYTMTAVNVPLGNNKVHQVTLVPADTHFPDIADKFAVAGLYHKAVGAVPRFFLAEQIWIYFCYDIGTESPDRVRILGDTNILGKTEIVA